jgi:Tol biopolymer transport system component
MKWLNGYRIRLVSIGFVAAILAGGGIIQAGFTFGTPQNLGPNINSSSIDAGTSISADGCTLYFSSNRPGGRGGWDLWVATRLTTDADWGPPENLGPTVNTPSDDGPGCISADGLSLYFASNRPGGFGSYDTWVTTRATKGGEWGIPVNLGPTVNSTTGDDHPSISADGLSLCFVSNRAGGSGSQDLWVTTRATLSDLWGPPVNLGPTVNSSNYEEWPSISADGLLLFFYSGPASKSGPDDIWVTRRATVSNPWGLPVNLGPPINTSAIDFGPNVSADGRTFYFTSNRPGGYGSFDIWQAPIIPTVDFNGDGKVDIQDLLRLIESWGKDDPSVDIGPMPWGDGKVDEKDLEVLMRYWQQEVLPVSLIAYWNLDEAEGFVAADKAGTNNGTLVGDPIWQPSGGKVKGALQLDGSDDYVTTDSVLDPAAGPLSVFAWVKGGGPGQVILSQAGGANWLMAGDPGGVLATELKESGRKGKPLVSAAVITDGAWHRVGLVWDGSNRILYVDDIEVVKDTQANLPSSGGGLYIGGGSSLALGTFWSGLIDDVRIYDRAVKP